MSDEEERERALAADKREGGGQLWGKIAGTK